LLRRGLVRTPDYAIARLVDESFRSAERLTDAAALLDDEHDSEAKALLVRAARLAADPSPPPAPTVRERPDASRFRRSGGGCYSGEDPRPTS
jgi:hypothetical protein